MNTCVRAGLETCGVVLLICGVLIAQEKPKPEPLNELGQAKVRIASLELALNDANRQINLCKGDVGQLQTQLSDQARTQRVDALKRDLERDNPGMTWDPAKPNELVKILVPAKDEKVKPER